jgi:hypothetical protein
MGVILASLARFLVRNMNLAKEAEHPRLQVRIVRRPRGRYRLLDCLDRIVLLVELPQRLANACQPLRLVGRIVVGPGQVQRQHQVIEGFDRHVHLRIRNA